MTKAKSASSNAARRRAGRRRASGEPVRLFRRRRTPPGAPPGTLIADTEALHPRIRLIGYDATEIEERDVDSLEALAALIRRHKVAWVDVQGLGDIQTIRALGEIFGLHSLALEDVVNVHQRPKVEDYGDHLFIVTRMPSAKAAQDSEQLALFLGAHYLLTFQENYGNGFDPIRHRLRTSPGGRIRSSASDYLAYTLLDAALDGFFPVLERYGETVEELESDVVARPDGGVITRVHALKRELLALRRAVWPQREMINALIRDDSPLMSEPTKLYLRDCYDHAVQVIEITETYREISIGLVDIYLSSVTARMNEIMKVLTVIATIFMPLGFIASLYGMNFDTAVSPWNMPELKWAFGYPFALAVMAAVVAVMLLYFRAKGWLTRERGPRAGPEDT